MPNNQRLSFGIAFIAVLFFIPFLGGVRLFDWDEINFAEAAREMIVRQEYLRVYIDFQPFWEKPPLFFWLQAASMHIFGVGEFAARFPNAICGVLTLLLLFRLGTKLYDTSFGLLWAGAYFGSVLPHLYFRSGIIDPFFNLFIFIGLNGLVFFHWKIRHFSLPLARKAWVYLCVGGLSLGLAILTKGPAALIVAGLVVGLFWASERFKWFVSFGSLFTYVLLACAVPLAWVGVEVSTNGTWFIREFLVYSYRLFSTPDAGHGGFPGYHVVVLFFGCFPASIFALRAMFSKPQMLDYQAVYRRWMLLLFGVVLVLFSIVQSKIVHYSSLCYFPITFFGAVALRELSCGRWQLNALMKIGLWAAGGLWGIVTVLVPFLGKNTETLRPLLSEDPFAQANLDGSSGWTGLEALVGLGLFLAILLFFRWVRQHAWPKAIATLFGGTAVFVTLTLWFFIGKIEGISQGSAMRFFEARQKEDCYTVTYNYRSYGNFFYTRERQTAQSRDMNWLLYSPEVDKPVYVITKNIFQAETDTISTLQKLGEENGFVFYQRKR